MEEHNRLRSSAWAKVAVVAAAAGGLAFSAVVALVYVVEGAAGVTEFAADRASTAFFRDVGTS